MDEQNLEAVIKAVLERVAPDRVVRADAQKAIPIELSGRHVHLSQADIDALFDGNLTQVSELSQPGQYLCAERVRLIGPKRVIDNVAVLGPARDTSQVEISLTDARALGLEAPVRQSGDLTGTPGIVLASRTGIVGLTQGVIVAARHIHMTPADGERFGVTDGQRVCVHMDGDRPAIFKDVIVRIHDSFRLAMHIDADEANSCGLKPGAGGTLVTSTQEAGCGLVHH